MKHKITTILILVSSLFLAVSFSPAALAADTPLKCSILPQFICDASKNSPDNGNVSNTGVFQLLKWVLRILTAGVGVAAVGTLVYAGILYSSAGGGSEQITKSKKLITDTVIGIVAFAMMFLVLNWLIPGGVIG